MLRVDWTELSLQDLRDTNEWMEREASPEFAIRTLKVIRRRAKFLVDFPHGGRPFRDGMRILRVLGTPYLIRYRILENTVQVLRVHREREDWTVEV